MIQLYGAISSRSRRCVWTAEEAGAEFHFNKIDFAKGEHRTPEYLKLQPLGKVPAMVHGELKLFESAAICTYIADCYPESGLVPEPRTPERAVYDQWVSFVISELEQPLWTMGKHKFALSREKRIPEMRDLGRWEFIRPALVIAKHLAEREFMLGDRFSVADVLVGHTLNWARGFGVQFPDPALADYLERLLARPAAQLAHDNSRYEPA